MSEFDEERFKQWLIADCDRKKTSSYDGAYVGLIKGSSVDENGVLTVGRPDGNKFEAFQIDDKRFHGKTVVDIINDGAISDFKKCLDHVDKGKISDEIVQKYRNTKFPRAIEFYKDMLEGIPRSLKSQQKSGQNHQDKVVEDFLKEKSSERNLIYFGAPGTGKSYALNEEAKMRFHGNVERVTFYADYLHSQFVGSYKPVMADNDTGIRYEFQPGPFTRILVKALEHEDTPYCLIIEELNRAEAASVFGDLFQLLDRDSNGVSQYPVSVSEDFKKYLKDKFTEDKEAGAKGQKRLNELVRKALYLGPDDIDAKAENNIENNDCGMIVIPSNMYIWATMNSADQGVFPLDTAFKRRWNFRYFPLDDGKEKMCTENDKYWNGIREAINSKLIALGVNEDKCMGPFFLNEEERNNDFDEAFKNKVIMYLFEDAAKYHKELFAQQNITLSGLFTAWGNDKKSVFCEDVAKVISNVSSSQQKSDGKAAPDKSNEQPGGENEDAPSADSANPEPAQDGNDD